MTLWYVNFSRLNYIPKNSLPVCVPWERKHHSKDILMLLLQRNSKELMTPVLWEDLGSPGALHARPQKLQWRIWQQHLAEVTASVESSQKQGQGPRVDLHHQTSLPGKGHKDQVPGGDLHLSSSHQ